MLAWSFWKSVRGRSLIAFLKLFAATVMFTPLVLMGWLIFWGVMVVVLAAVIWLFNPNQLLFQVLTVGIVLAVLLVGTPMGWRYLDAEIPDIKDFKL